MKFILCAALLASYSCIGFQSDPTVAKSPAAGNMIRNARLEFTGFTHYDSEKELLLNEIVLSGIRSDDLSKNTIEIILEEKPPIYKSPGLHFNNLIFSVLSLSLIPYHTNTHHRISYRIYSEHSLISESEYRLELSQFRGLLVIFLSPFFWPSTAFDKSIKESWRMEKFQNDLRPKKN
ncbi:hypothetical protein LEP1GSC050_1724 [Leptospira broomii serovar Hurstbridge str. 5399]|uniref:Lipoprotein n=1 Tax=Leptospira broomii serovar Hurstbridge str. 5399 TaxID=1049789 RepID=T0F7M1_9LEPT|nr:hypothetical protein [Leptospira broomii]EQA43502.1 hypothetical protein LEP1GSC050_1724 [Leptospira broomii serovar Hurstbridge str. 5399]